MNKERLLKVAQALRESPAPSKFTMEFYGYDCGTPACAFGHYAARNDLQDAFTLMGDSLEAEGGASVDYLHGDVLEHFDITCRDSKELFGPEGCDGAADVYAAAEYIERFVKEHQ